MRTMRIRSVAAAAARATPWRRHSGAPGVRFHALFATVLSLATAFALVACGGDELTPTGVDGGGATRLVFVTQPTDATAGEVISPAVQVELRDASGSPVTGSSARVSVALQNNPADGTLEGTTAVSVSDGVATFADLIMERAADGYTLRATASGFEAALSEPFRITPAAASQLSFATGPSDAEGQEPISPAVEVALQDAFGNTVTGSTTDITIALAADPTGGEATLSGAVTVSAMSGVAAFTDLSIDLPADGFTLEATASGLPAVTSGPFSVHLTFVQTSAGRFHTCGVTVADHAYCWGTNYAGQLGDGTETSRSTPVAVSTTKSFVQVSASWTHTCGVTTEDEAFCWGSNQVGQLGDPAIGLSLTPVAVSTTESFVQVSAGNFYTCGVTTAGEAFCWGRNNRAQLGDGTTTNRSSPVAVSTTESFAQVSAGGEHTCGVTTNDEAFCWGRNFDGQLGDGTITQRSSPVAVSTTELFARVSAGGHHTCGITTADAAFCWGRNFDGQLGDSTTSDRLTPEAVSTTELFAQVSAGAEDHTCGVTTDGVPFCWGENDFGQFGDGTTTDSSTPVAVSTTEPFAQVSAGADHSCGLTTAGEAFCWGYNDDGQLGDGTTTDSSTPVRVVQ